MPTIETDWKTLNRFPWDAIFKCAQQYQRENPSHTDHLYREYLRDIWGIDQSSYEHFKVVDEKKYMMFLLRWA